MNLLFLSYFRLTVGAYYGERTRRVLIISQNCALVCRLLQRVLCYAFDPFISDLIHAVNKYSELLLISVVRISIN